MQLFIPAAAIAEQLSQLRLLSPICFSEKPPDFSSNRIIGKSSLPGEPRSFPTTRKCLAGGSSSTCILRMPTIWRELQFFYPDFWSAADCSAEYLFSKFSRPHYLSDSLSTWYMRKLIGSWNTNLEWMQFSGDYIKGL